MAHPMHVVISLMESEHHFDSFVETLLQPRHWQSTVQNMIDEIHRRESVDLSLFRESLCMFPFTARSFTSIPNFYEVLLRVVIWIPANHANYNLLEANQNALNSALLRNFQYHLLRAWGPNHINYNVLQDNQDVLDMVLQRSFDESLSGVRAVPATMEAINKLSTFIVGEGGDEDSTVADVSCAVCLEDIVLGEEACGMPCSHAYHSGCIRRWLEASRLCPLCRFTLE